MSISNKRLEKIENILTEAVLVELRELSPQEAKDRIVAAESAMKQAREELENNPKYQALKEDLKALSAGMKEVNKYQKAVIEYVLYLLEEKGQ